MRAFASSRFEDYGTRYSSIHMQRTDAGLLTLRFHTEDGPFQWGGAAHSELAHAFRDIADDLSIAVIVMTGTGAAFSGPPGSLDAADRLSAMGGREHAALMKEAKDLLLNLLRIEAPVIAAINGPALRHAEIPLMSDIVLASDDAYFQDTAHFINRTAPGDGQHILLPLVMGLNRARYYLLTGQRIDAAEALKVGLVNEVLARDMLLPRAYELAEMIMRQPRLVVRNTRLVLVEQLKRTFQQLLEHGLVLETQAMMGWNSPAPHAPGPGDE